MKTLNILLALVITLMSVTANAQATGAAKKETVKVWGNCEMCESRIEKAAKAAGASSAKWDVDSKMLSVTYSPSKSTINKIEKTVAAAGYDTEHVKGSDTGYHNLPECCQYDRRGAVSDTTSKTK